MAPRGSTRRAPEVRTSSAPSEREADVAADREDRAVAEQESHFAAEEHRKIYGLVDSPVVGNYTNCAAGCLIQRVDVQSRTIDTGTQKLYSISPGKIVATRFDATSNALIVGYDNVDSSGITTGMAGYGVELLAY